MPDAPDGTLSQTRPAVTVCVKWTAQEIDADAADVRFAGVSEADQAALETALVLGEHLSQPVTAVTVGPSGCRARPPGCDRVRGASAVRVDAADELESVDVARESRR
jgi:hypothetical protein